MKFGSLFSGIEAASAAWLPLGWSCAWVAEIDPFACAVLKHHYPTVPNLGDITRVNWDATEPVDLVVGGPPCQDFSVAGKRAGLDGERGDLSLAYVRALDAIDPAWSLTENVPGWLSMGDNAFGRFLAAMVGSGAPLIPRRGQRWTDAGLVTGPKRTAAWRVLDAQFHGVPQRRRRVFVVACRGAGNWACAAALFPQQQSVPKNFAPRRQAGEDAPAKSLCGSDGGIDREDRHTLIAFSAKDHGADAGDTAPTLRAGGHDRSYANAGVMPAIAFQRNAGRDFTGDEDRAPPLRGDGGGWGGSAAVAHSLRADGFDEDGTGRGTPLIPVMAAGAGGANGAGIARDGDPMFTLDSTGAHAVMTAVPLDMRQISRGENEPRPNGSGGGAGVGNAGDPAYTVTDAPHAVMTLAIRGGGDSHDLEYRDDGIANAILTPNGGRAGIGVGAVAFDMFNQAAGDVTHTLRVATDSGLQSTPHVHRPRMSVRRLTPVECEKLQGFPPGYTDVPYRGKPASDGPRYRSIGNSMAVPVVRWLGQRIQAFET